MDIFKIYNTMNFFKKKYFYVVILIALAIVGFNIYFSFFKTGLNTTSGIFGDTWGFSSAFFNLLSLLLIVFTLVIQKEEMTNNSLVNTFMNMVNIHANFINDFHIIDSNNEISGRGVFKYHYSKLENKSLEEIEEYFKNNMLTDYSFYFENVYRVLKFVDESFNPNAKSHYEVKQCKESFKYAAIFRSNFNLYELYWIQVYYFYLKQREPNSKSLLKFKNLLEKNTFFKLTTTSDQFVFNSQPPLFKQTAFKSPVQ